MRRDAVMLCAFARTAVLGNTHTLSHSLDSSANTFASTVHSGSHSSCCSRSNSFDISLAKCFSRISNSVPQARRSSRDCLAKVSCYCSVLLSVDAITDLLTCCVAYGFASGTANSVSHIFAQSGAIRRSAMQGSCMLLASHPTCFPF